MIFFHFQALFASLLDGLDHAEQCFALSHLLCELCFLLTEFDARSGESLFVLILDVLHRYSKVVSRVRAQSLKRGNSNTVQELEQQNSAMSTAISQTPEVWKQSLLNKFTK